MLNRKTLTLLLFKYSHIYTFTQISWIDYKKRNKCAFYLHWEKKILGNVYTISYNYHIIRIKKKKKLNM